MGRKMKDLTGKIFGRLVVLEFSHSSFNKKKHYWKCLCSCENKNVVIKREDVLKKEKYPSCGCWVREIKHKYNKYNIAGEFGIGYIKEHEFYFDIKDYDLIKNYCWGIDIGGYVVSTVKRKPVRMHRLIMDCPENFIIDHINGNRTDNRKANLRIVTHRENAQNRKTIIKKTSIYNGVYYSKQKNKWVARIYSLEGKCLVLGCYSEEIDAAIAYDKKAIELGYLTRNILS